MENVKCDFCNKPATTFDTQKLCSEHNEQRERIRKSWRVIQNGGKK